MRVLKRGDVDQDDALAVIVEAVLEFIVHDVTGGGERGESALSPRCCSPCDDCPCNSGRSATLVGDV